MVAPMEPAIPKKKSSQYLANEKNAITYHPERNCTPNEISSAKRRSRQVLLPQTAHVVLSNEGPTIGQNLATRGVATQFHGLQSGR